jgi:hypothetical protein
VICVDCGFDTAAADLASVVAMLAGVDERVGAWLDELRHPAAASALTRPPPDVGRVLALCSAMEDTRRALLGIPRRPSTSPSRAADTEIPMYSALAVLTTEAGWLQRASVSLAPRSASPTIPDDVAEAVHDLHHATSALGLGLGYSAGETSPLS